MWDINGQNFENNINKRSKKMATSCNRRYNAWSESVQIKNNISESIFVNSTSIKESWERCPLTKIEIVLCMPLVVWCSDDD